MSERAQITQDIKQRVLAGNAIFTILNTESGVRFTFKVVKPNEKTPHFVKVLTGPDNKSDYTYLGTIFQESNYRHGKKSSISKNAPSAVAFAWFWLHIDELERFPSLQVWHEGFCCACGRSLTDPDSISRGIGPVCLAKSGKPAFEIGLEDFSPLTKTEVISYLAAHYPFDQAKQWGRLQHGQFVTVGGQLIRKVK